IRGYRVELGEIEHHLNTHPAIKHAIIIIREYAADDIRLVAYLLFREAAAPATDDLRAYLRQKLPDYMIPGEFIKLDSIPLLPNDKADIKALPKPEFRKTPDRSLERLYRNDVERSLAAIWEEVLGTEKFGFHDSFFEVGGHSLLVAKMRQLIEDRIGVEVSN